jgi:uncharacterized membrane protein YcaP (DUF421 family)
MFQLAVSPLELIVRTTVVYVLFFGLLRISGKRELGQFTLFDLALVLLAANAVQPAITGPDSSLLGGAIILVWIFLLNRGFAELRERVPWVRRALEIPPTVIGRDGAWLTEVVEREGLDETDLGAALREHGLESVEQMALATLEQDGSISVVARGDEGNAARRRRRYRRRL